MLMFPVPAQLGTGNISNCSWLCCVIHLTYNMATHWASQVAVVVKNLPANTEDTRDSGSVLRSGRSPGGGNGSPLQYSCLGNPMDSGTWRATVHGVAKSQTRQHHHHYHGYILALFRTFPGNRDFRKILEKDWGKKNKLTFSRWDCKF